MLEKCKLYNHINAWQHFELGVLLDYCECAYLCICVKVEAYSTQKSHVKVMVPHIKLFWELSVFVMVTSKMESITNFTNVTG